MTEPGAVDLAGLLARGPQRVRQLATAVPGSSTAPACAPGGVGPGTAPVWEPWAASTRPSRWVGHPGREAQPIFWPLMPLRAWSWVPPTACFPGPAALASAMRHLEREAAVIAADTTAPVLGGGSGRGRR